MSNIELFLKHFDRIHKCISSETRNRDFEYSSFVSDLREINKKNKVVTKHFDTLKKFADFRNLDAHSNDLAPHFAEPHADIVKLIEKIADELNPEAKALDYAVTSDRIYSATLADQAKKVIRHMIDENFTHVPILNEKEKMIGVFSESSVFNYFVSHEEIILDGTVTNSEFEDFIGIEARPNEVFRFLSRNELLINAKDLFTSEQPKRLGAIFITENGSPTEKLLGLLTPWDVLPH